MPARSRRRPPRLGADRDPAAVDESQHRPQVVLRGAFHVAPRQLHRVELLLLAAVDVAEPGLLHRVGQFVGGGDLGLGRRRDERPQALRQVRRNDRRGLVAVGRIEEEAQPGGFRTGRIAIETEGQLAVLRLELVWMKNGVRGVQGFAHREPLGFVEPVPQLHEGVAGQMAFDGDHHVGLARRERSGYRQQTHQWTEGVAGQQRERLGYRGRWCSERARHVSSSGVERSDPIAGSCRRRRTSTSPPAGPEPIHRACAGGKPVRSPSGATRCGDYNATQHCAVAPRRHHLPSRQEPEPCTITPPPPTAVGARSIHPV